MKRRVLSIVLCLGLLVGLMPFSAAAADTVQSGTCGENLTWTLDSDVLTISGTGDMTDYSDSNPAPWSSERFTLKKVIIEQGVTGIGNYAFNDARPLSSVTIPEGVTRIGDDAFYWCVGLKSIDLPNSLTSIGMYSFCGLGMSNLILPEGLTEIGDSAFSKCTQLTAVEIPKNVTSIGTDIFSQCTSLTEISVAEDNTAYASDGIALFNKEKTSLLAFPCGRGGTYSIPDSVTYIAPDAFECCSALTEVEFPEGVETICGWAFRGCTGLEKVVLPASVTSIINFAFAGCTGLTGAYFKGDAPTEFGSGVFGKDPGLNPGDGGNLPNLTVYYIDGKNGWTTPEWNGYPTATWDGVNIPSTPAASGTCGENLTWTLDSDGILTISGTGEMSNYPYPWENPTPWGQEIKSVVVENGVTSIGDYAFWQCNNMTSITLPERMTRIGECAFNGCTALESIVLPEGITDIYYSTFGSCTALKSVTIPEGVTMIANSAFYNCTSLTEIIIPESVTSIEDRAFGNSRNLKKVCFKGDAPQISDYYVFRDGSTDEQWNIPGLMLYYINGKTGWTSPTWSTNAYPTATWDGVNIPDIHSGTCGDNLTWSLDDDGVLTISGAGKMTDFTNGSLSNTIPWYGARLAIKTVQVESGVTSIGSYAFADCVNLEQITLPEGITRIAFASFYGCTSLKDIQLPSGLTNIESSTFSGCSSLTKVVIPESVSSIAMSAFFDCTALQGVYFVGPAPSVGMFAFQTRQGDESSSRVNIPGLTLYYVEGKSGWTTPTWGSDAYPTATWNGVNVPIESGTCGENLTWMFDSTGVLTISGTGDMEDYDYSSAESIRQQPWEKYSSKIQRVVIGDGVTSIDKYAFYYFTELSEICVDENNAAYCSDEHGFLFNKERTELVHVPAKATLGYYTIPEGVTSIADYAFQYCTDLKGITIPEGVTSIGGGAFWGCGYMENISIPATVTTIGHSAFWFCVALTNLTVPEGVTSIGDGAFDYCTGLTSFTIPSSVTSIADSMFFGCSGLKSVTIPDSVTSIGNYAFHDCEALTDVTIPDGVTSIGDYAFYGCKVLTRACFKGDAPTVGSFAFQIFYETGSTKEHINIPGLTLYYIDGKEGWTTPTWSSDAYPTATWNGVNVPIESGTCGENLTWTLDSGVLTISGTGDMTDYSDNNPAPWSSERFTLKKVIIEQGVTGIGNYAFNDTRPLSSVTIPEGVTRIGDDAFYWCVGLKTIDLPNSLTSIGMYSFCGLGMSNLILPEGLTEIGDSAFSKCTQLTAVEIPKNVTSIGTDIFSQCTSLTEISVAEDNTAYALVSHGKEFRHHYGSRRGPHCCHS